MQFEFEWDILKSQSNKEKHGVHFERAALIFEGPILRKQDTRQDYGEDRFIAIGIVEGECLVVVYTERGDRLRLISAWKGGADESHAYETYLARSAAGQSGEG